MVKQYPHYLFEVKSGDSVQDDDGNWTEPATTMDFISVCREETNNNGDELQVAGGRFYRFSSLVQLPKGAQAIEAGATVVITDNKDQTGERLKGTVLKFDKGQLHSRLWL